MFERERLLGAVAVLLLGCAEQAVAEAQGAPTPGTETPGAVPETNEPEANHPEANQASPPAVEPSAVASQPAPAFVPGAPADYVGKHVVVPDGTTLYRAPDPKALAAVMHLTAADPALPAAATMEVVGHEGEYLAVRPALDDKRCTPAIAGLEAFDLKVWIRSDAPQVVVAVPTIVVHANGDRARVWPGAPLHQDGQRMTIDVGGIALTGHVDAAATSTTFEPEAPPTISAQAVALQAGPAITWGGTAITERNLGGVEVGGNVAVLRGGANAGQSEVVTAWASCAELTATVDSSRPDTTRRDASGLAARRGMASRRYLDRSTFEVTEGTDVYWRDGAAAGTSIKPFTFDGAPRTRKGKRCFVVPLQTLEEDERGAKDARLELCFDAESVVEYESPKAVALSSGVLGMLGAAGSDEAMLGVLGSTESALLFADLGGEAVDISAGSGVLGGIASTGMLDSAASAKPKVEIGKGGAATGVGGRFIRARLGALRRCYETELRAKEGASGRLKLTITTDSSGAVTNASVTDDTVSGSVGDCIVEIAEDWALPASVGATSLTVPIVFKSL